MTVAAIADVGVFQRSIMCAVPVGGPQASVRSGVAHRSRIDATRWESMARRTLPSVSQPFRPTVADGLGYPLRGCPCVSLNAQAREEGALEN
jgi:hypothetical protein